MPTNTDSTYFKVRSFFRAQILNLLGMYSKPAPGIHILNGHRIENEAEPETFRSLLSELSKEVKFIRFEDAVEMIERHENPKDPLVAFSFDDGFMECYEVFAPVLEEFGTNAMFFVNPNYVDGDEAYIKNFNENTVLTHNKRPMRWQHLKELSNKGFLIGAHTMDHFMINSTDKEKLMYEIVNCKSAIEQHIDKPCEYFAFPYGKISEANEMSIDLALSTYSHVFAQSEWKRYYSFNGRVINRRQFEVFWPIRHINYFLSYKKRY